MRILGIDPGIEGAMAVVAAGDAWGADVETLPTVGEDTKRVVEVQAVARWIRQQKPDRAVIEWVSAMREWGVGGTFRFGQAFGMLRAAVALCDVPYVLVVPRRWKKFYDFPSGDTKALARQRAIEQWPTLAEKLARVKDHQRAEALLIANYGARMIALGGNGS